MTSLLYANRPCYNQRDSKNRTAYPDWRQHPKPIPFDYAAEFKGNKQQRQEPGKARTTPVVCLFQSITPYDILVYSVFFIKSEIDVKNE